MASEAALRNTVKHHLGMFGALVRIENKCDQGTPDICYALRWRKRYLTGWLELKQVDRWPARPDTCIDVGLTLNQLLWAERWAPFGAVHLLVQVERDLILFDAAGMRPVWCGLAKQPFLALAVAKSPGKLRVLELLQGLSACNITNK